MIQDLLVRARGARAGARDRGVARRRDHGWRLRGWRSLWEHAVNHGWPLFAIEWVEARFLDAGWDEALNRAASEYAAATAETIPAPPEADPGRWVALCGDAPHCEPGDGLHDETPWPTSTGGGLVDA